MSFQSPSHLLLVPSNSRKGRYFFGNTPTLSIRRFDRSVSNESELRQVYITDLFEPVPSNDKVFVWKYTMVTGRDVECSISNILKSGSRDCIFNAGLFLASF